MASSCVNVNSQCQYCEIRVKTKCLGINDQTGNLFNTDSFLGTYFASRCYWSYFWLSHVFHALAFKNVFQSVHSC